MNVLYAEDNRDLRFVTQMLLEQLGHVVVAANDGHDAYTLLMGQQQFDVLVTDIEMPRVGGIELIQRLRNADRWNFLKIVAMTGNTEKKQDILDAGADLFLLKSDLTAVADLTHAIERWSSLR